PAPVSTRTWWPWETYSRTEAGVRPTRYSWFFISLGHPTRMVNSSRTFGHLRVIEPQSLVQVFANTLAASSIDRYSLREMGQLLQEKRKLALDRIDIAILEALQKDGRMSNAALAEKVGLSQSACSRRLENLEKSGTIRGYHAQLSNAALG